MIKASLYNFFGRIYIPDSFDFQAPYLLHISDTPSAIFSSLNSFIQKVQPKIIIHTGDLVDNLKLELYLSVFDSYKRYLKQLVRILEGGEREVFYVLGNHDDADTILHQTVKGTLIKDYTELPLHKFIFGVSHKFSDIKHDKADYVLFGHNLDKYSDYNSKPRYLNGIEKISLINLNTGEIITFDYPIGTKESRLKIYRKGL